MGVYSMALEPLYSGGIEGGASCNVEGCGGMHPPPGFWIFRLSQTAPGGLGKIYSTNGMAKIYTVLSDKMVLMHLHRLSYVIA